MVWSCSADDTRKTSETSVSLNTARKTHKRKAELAKTNRVNKAENKKAVQKNWGMWKLKAGMKKKLTRKQNIMKENPNRTNMGVDNRCNNKVIQSCTKK